MKIQEANKKAGDLDQICLPDYKGWYCLIVEGEPCWYDNKTDSMLRNVLGREAIREDWEVCQREKEIRPEKAGELWKCGDSYAHTEQARGVVWVCFMNMNHKAEDSDIVHGENWTRLFPKVEDDSVKRIEIEGVTWAHPASGHIYPDIVDIHRFRLPQKAPMKMILEMPKAAHECQG